MFFFKQKKLVSIEEKVDLILQKLEEQKQDICSIEEKYQIISKLLEEKVEALINEYKDGLESIKIGQRDGQLGIISSVEQNEREIKNRLDILESGVLEFELRLISVIGQNDTKAKELFRDQKKRIRDIDESLGSIKKEVVEAQKMKADIIDKLDLTENEVRMLLVNSVLDQIPS